MKLTKTMFSLTICLLLANSAWAKEHVVDQKNREFVIDGKNASSIEVQKGDTIKFVNQDPYFHNIFSLSDLKVFDLGSFPQGESKSVTFEQSGELEVECAIHPNMHLKVTVN